MNDSTIPNRSPITLTGKIRFIREIFRNPFKFLKVDIYVDYIGNVQKFAREIIKGKFKSIFIDIKRFTKDSRRSYRVLISQEVKIRKL